MMKLNQQKPNREPEQIIEQAPAQMPPQNPARKPSRKKKPKWRQPCVNYLEFRPSKIWEESYRHLLLLLYWPFFGLMFAFVERAYIKYLPALGKTFHYVHCGLDDLIPFNEWFLIPYMFWFAYIILSLGYTLLYDVEVFKKTMKFIMVTYTVALLFYFTYPTAQALRPTTFEHDNLLTRLIEHFYAFDTNTNVCPSIHVFGSFASTLAFLNANGIKKGVKVLCHVANLLICLSTMFLKQHSAIDVIVALPICAVGYLLCFVSDNKTAKESEKRKISEI